MLKKARQLKVRITDAVKVKEGIFCLRLFSPYLTKVCRPGNFIQVKIEPVILRRPLSIHRVEKDSVFLLFRVRGKGTKALSEKRAGDKLDLIGPLGKGFELKKVTPVLIGGGMGVAPLLFLGQQLTNSFGKTKKEGREQALAILGAACKKEVLCDKEFKRLGFRLAIATDDGSQGYKGNVAGLLARELKQIQENRPIAIYACGPQEMFKAISKIVKNRKRIEAQFSFEQFMGCGLGVCFGCAILTKEGYKKVCQEGPVFDSKVIY